MIHGLLGLAEEGAAFLPDEFDESTANLSRLLLADLNAELHTIIRAYPMPFASDTPSLLPYGFGYGSFGWVDPDDIIDDNDAVLVSQRLFYTGDNDVPANHHVEARLAVAFNYQSGISQPLAGSGVASGFGQIVYSNPDGDKDAFINMSWDGRPVQVFVGGTFNKGRFNETVLEFNEYATAFSGLAAGIEWDNQRITVALSSPELKFNLPFNTSTYAGTGVGDIEGDTENAGQVRPTTLGQVSRIPGKIIDKTNFVYQVHDGEISAVTAGYNDATLLTSAGSVADVWAWTPVTDQYVYDLTNGLIRLGSEQTGQVSFDVKGSTLGGSYDNDAAYLARWLAQQSGLPLEQISYAAVSSRPSGVYYDGLVTIKQAINDLINPFQAWHFAFGGVFTIVDYIDPADVVTFFTLIDGNPDGTNETANIVAGSLKSGVSPQPVWRVAINHSRNNTRLNEGAEYTEEYETSAAENLITKGSFPRAREIEINGLGSASEDTLAAALLSSERKRKRVYSMVLTRLKFRLAVGDVVTLKSDRFGLSSGIKGQILKLVERDNVTEITGLFNV